jgi:DeoR family suf operon transcriptional repressor
MDQGLPTGTKRSLLDLLLRMERTAEDLAARLGVSPTAVRQHLSMLVGSGFVERRTAEPVSGRPAYLYRLSELGRRLYPKRHDLFLRGLVEALLTRQGREWTLEVVAGVGRDLATAARDDRNGRDVGERWSEALEWLETELGWEAEVEELPGGGRRVVLHQCPFRAVSADHPAVCGTFLSALLDGLTGAGPFTHRSIGDGLRCCALEAGRARSSDAQSSRRS